MILQQWEQASQTIQQVQLQAKELQLEKEILQDQLAAARSSYELLSADDAAHSKSYTSQIGTNY